MPHQSNLGQVELGIQYRMWKVRHRLSPLFFMPFQIVFLSFWRCLLHTGFKDDFAIACAISFVKISFDLFWCTVGKCSLLSLFCEFEHFKLHYLHYAVATGLVLVCTRSGYKFNFFLFASFKRSLICLLGKFSRSFQQLRCLDLRPLKGFLN